MAITARRFDVHLDTGTSPFDPDEAGRQGVSGARNAWPGLTEPSRMPFLSRTRRTWSDEVGQFRVGLLVGSVISRLLPAHTASRTRAAVLRTVGVSIGRGTVLAGPLHLDGTDDPRRTLRIGADCYVNTGCRIDASSPVTIGDRVYLSQDVLIITNSHVLGDPRQRAGALSSAPISIGEGCWVGARSTILPGVEIGRGVIVAAGAVVVDDVAPNTLVAGVPARAIRDLGPGVDTGADGR